MRLRDLSPSAAVLATLLVAPEFSTAFYLPGVAPTTYKRDDIVPLNVNRLTPVGSYTDGQLRSMVSFDYYHPAFHFCRPEPQPEYVSESLGSILFGDRIMTSPFQLQMMKNETCKRLCDSVKFDQMSAHFVNRRIAQGFALNWLVDGLPAGQLIEDEVTNTKFYSQGFALGSSDDKEMHLNNHYDILIDYHELQGDQFRVVGVIVQPDSRKTQPEGNGEDGNYQNHCGVGGPPLTLDENGETEVSFTYSIYWFSTLR